MDLVIGSKTFAFREEGMPSELQASPMGHQATLSSTMIERQEISEANVSPPLDTLSPADEVSQAAFSTNSLNTEAHRMVDNLVDSEPAEKDDHKEDYEYGYVKMEPTPLAPACEITTSGEVAETSYGFSSNLFGSDLIRVLHEYSPQQQTHGTPRPHLPSIYDPAFGPEVTPTSRPTTARRLSPHHSQRGSVNKIPPQQHFNSYVIDSTASSMPDASSYVSPHTPTNNHRHITQYRTMFADEGHRTEANYGAIGQPVSRNKEDFSDLDSGFQSSKIIDGSTWRSAQSIRDALNFHTPPNEHGTE